MVHEHANPLQNSYFNLKHQNVNLVHPIPDQGRVFLKVKDLESMRVRRPAIPASKHGLEVICGASCETGAQ